MSRLMRNSSSDVLENQILMFRRSGLPQRGEMDGETTRSLCTEILTNLFKPALGPPDIQNRSDDGFE
jgi:hypothetical protein